MPSGSAPTSPKTSVLPFAGNHDNLFRLGLKLTRKTLKYFSQFCNSDIILASPLGLRMTIGDESDKKTRLRFPLQYRIGGGGSSRRDTLLMQNWDHIEHIFKHLNLIPKDPHGCDFGRVRNWYLDTNAKYFGRTLVLGGFVTPEMMKLFNQSMLNAAGKVKTQAQYAGSMVDLGVQVRQAMPPPAPNPTIPLTNYHIIEIHKKRSPNLSGRPRRPLRLFHKSSPTFTPPKHLHRYINLHTELL